MIKQNGPGVYLSYDAADEVTICTLTNMVELVENDITRLESKEILENYQQEDLKHSREILVHLKAVIKYYGG